jgi:hypothetical protein
MAGYRLMTQDKPKPMRYCAYCGEELGRISNWERGDTCGAPECNRWSRDVHEEERKEAHRRVDRDFDRW